MPETIDRYYRLIGRSRPMQDVYDRIANFGPTLIPVLILGETGTGKELCADALWMASGAQRPYVAASCACFAATLIESDLFGHKRGAFTGARQQRAGIIEQASGGTLFLDEVADLPPHTQAKLLRVLETGEYRRVGGEGVRRSGFRVIAATSRDADSLTVGRDFRPDLLHRLGKARITMPPLRERRDDVRLLAEWFLESVEPPTDGRAPPTRIADGAMELLTSAPWPGNVRELKNVIETAAALCCGRSIEVCHVAEVLLDQQVPQRTPERIVTLADSVRRAERDAILAALGTTNTHEQAAELLDISVSTLRRKLKVLQNARDILNEPEA